MRKAIESDYRDLRNLGIRALTTSDPEESIEAFFAIDDLPVTDYQVSGGVLFCNVYPDQRINLGLIGRTNASSIHVTREDVIYDLLVSAGYKGTIEDFRKIITDKSFDDSSEDYLA